MAAVSDHFPKIVSEKSTLFLMQVWQESIRGEVTLQHTLYFKAKNSGFILMNLANVSSIVLSKMKILFLVVYEIGENKNTAKFSRVIIDTKFIINNILPYMSQ